jgi:uncharacterized membrane protein YeaQ/YmgE (transglycosylase-associated protein family)
MWTIFVGVAPSGHTFEMETMGVVTDDILGVVGTAATGIGSTFFGGDTMGTALIIVAGELADETRTSCDRLQPATNGRRNSEEICIYYITKSSQKSIATGIL